MERPDPPSRADGSPEDVPTEEITLSDDDWPVAEHYRVVPDTPVAEVDGEAPPTNPTVVAPADGAPPAARLRSREFGIGLVLLAVAALLLLSAGGLWLLTRDGGGVGEAAPPTDTGPGSTPPPTTDTTPTTGGTANPSKLPALVGLDLAAARRELADADMRSRIRRVDSSQPRDEVLAQSPEAGAAPPENGIVTLTVSNGTKVQAAGVSVPDVVGMSARDASSALRNAGLRPAIRTVRAEEPAGTVVAQSPEAGTDVDRESVVSLRVAKPKPKPKPVAPVRISVPDVVGSTLSEAQRALREAGLRWTVSRVDSEEPPGTVVAQTPRAGARVDEGRAVALRVSAGPSTVAVPDVTGLAEEAARNELQSAGFDVTVVDEPTSDATQDGTVVSQDPAGGTDSRPGTLVTITVARFA
jgi:beta-lactam-binding protein with PASTA domain